MVCFKAGRAGVVLAGILWCAVLAGSGCGGGDKGRIWVYHYPAFYAPELKRIAVIPFANRSADPAAGDRISGKVSAQLTSNGTYEVYTRANLQDVLAEKDMADAGIIEGEAAMELGRLKAVQALVCGVCDRYEMFSRSEVRYNTVPQFGQDAYGNVVITGFIEVPYQWQRYDGHVECRVVVVDTATGRQIAAVTEPSNIYAEGSPPKHGPDAVLLATEEDQINRIVRAIAVTRTEIRLKGRVVRTASGLYDNAWDWKETFSGADQQGVVVVTLPPEADRNTFRVTIIRKGEREVLHEEAFEWDKQNASRGITFSPGELLSKRGPGTFEAKLYSGPEPIAWHSFNVRERG